MSRDLRIGSAARDTQATALLALLNSGSVNVYTDNRPDHVGYSAASAGADGSYIPSGVLLATFTLASTAFGTSVGGAAKMNTISATTGLGTGQPTWFRAFRSNGVPVMDGAIAADGSGDMALSVTRISKGDAVSISSWVFVEPSVAYG